MGQGTRSTRIREATSTSEASSTSTSIEDLSSPPLKEWCREYAGNDAILKEFMMRRVLWGWDFGSVVTGESRGL
jgi:hypothetical protein